LNKTFIHKIAELKNSIQELLINLDSRFKLGLIGFIVGVTSGLAAVALTFALKYIASFINQHQNQLIDLILPIIGIFLTVVFLKYIIRDFGGHGLPEVIHSISLKGGKIKLRSSVSRLIGSLLTISSGGSAGPEAPVVVSGSAIGSNFASLFKTDERIRIAVSGSGAAAAIAAIFNAPLTGIIFTMEVIIGEWTPIYLLPVVIASVTGTEISRLLQGNQIPFEHHDIGVSVTDITAAVGLAILCALFSIIFIKLLRGTSNVLTQKIKNSLTKAVLAAIPVALIVFFLPQVRGEGYEFVEKLISGRYEEGILLIFLVVIFKIVATSFTLGAGGAGGVFAPALVIGSATGYLFYAIIRSISPDITLSSSGLYALMGMSGLISGILNAPLTGIFLIIEITDGYDAILPLLLVSFLSITIVRFFEHDSIYHYDLIRKGLLHRPRTDGRILADIKPIELLEKDQISIYPDYKLKDLLPVIKKSARNYFPVIDPNTENFLGMIYFNDIKEFIFDPTLQESILVEEIMHTDLITVSLSDSLIDIQQKFDDTNTWSLPVVEKNKFMGLISKASMLDLYRKELKVQTDR
jgi:chloride channel protein, CIC family